MNDYTFIYKDGYTVNNNILSFDRNKKKNNIGQGRMKAETPKKKKSRH